jgi:hypothetical protein
LDSKEQALCLRFDESRTSNIKSRLSYFRSRLLPLAVLGDAIRWRRERSRVPVVADSETGYPENFPEGGTIYAGPVSARKLD